MPKVPGSVLVLAVVASGAEARAAAPRSAYAVVIPAASEQQAKDRLTALVDVYVYARILGYEGVPKVFAPGELPVRVRPRDKDAGAEWLVVVSFCSKKDAAVRAAAVRERAPAVTTVQVSGDYPGACLGRRAFAPMSDEERGYVKAIVDDPKSAKPRVFYAGFLQSETRFAEAERVLEKALEIEPDNEEAKGLLRMTKLMGKF